MTRRMALLTASMTLALSASPSLLPAVVATDVYTNTEPVLIGDGDGYVVAAAPDTDAWGAQIAKHASMYSVGIEMCSGPMVTIGNQKTPDQRTIISHEQACVVTGFSSVDPDTQLSSRHYCPMHQVETDATTNRANLQDLTRVATADLPKGEAGPIKVSDEWKAAPPAFVIKKQTQGGMDSNVMVSRDLFYEKASQDPKHGVTGNSFAAADIIQGGKLNEEKSSCTPEVAHLEWGEDALVDGDGKPLCIKGDDGTSPCSFRVFFISQADLKKQILYPASLCSVLSWHNKARVRDGAWSFTQTTQGAFHLHPPGDYVLAVVAHLQGRDRAVLTFKDSKKLCVLPWAGDPKDKPDDTKQRHPTNLTPPAETEAERIARINADHRREGRNILVATAIPVCIVVIVLAVYYWRASRAKMDDAYQRQRDNVGDGGVGPQAGMEMEHSIMSASSAASTEPSQSQSSMMSRKSTISPDGTTVVIGD